MPRFCATRIFALEQEDRAFYLSFFLLSLPPPLPLSPLPRLYLENGRTGRYPDRKRGPWTSPSLFLLSRERRITSSRDRPRLASSHLCPSSFPHVSLFLLRIFILISMSRSASYIISCSSIFVSLQVSHFSNYSFLSFYRPPVLRNGYIYIKCLSLLVTLNLIDGFSSDEFSIDSRGRIVWHYSLKLFMLISWQHKIFFFLMQGRSISIWRIQYYLCIDTVC